MAQVGETFQYLVEVALPVVALQHQAVGIEGRNAWRVSVGDELERFEEVLLAIAEVRGDLFQRPSVVRGAPAEVIFIEAPEL